MSYRKPIALTNGSYMFKYVGNKMANTINVELISLKHLRTQNVKHFNIPVNSRKTLAFFQHQKLYVKRQMPKKTTMMLEIFHEK